MPKMFVIVPAEDSEAAESIVARVGGTVFESGAPSNLADQQPTFNLFSALTVGDEDCNIAAPTKPIRRVFASSGNLIYRCRHDSTQNAGPHEWKLDGTRLR